jgi:hypothetical protein
MPRRGRRQAVRRNGDSELSSEGEIRVGGVRLRLDGGDHVASLTRSGGAGLGRGRGRGGGGARGGGGRPPPRTRSARLPAEAGADAGADADGVDEETLRREEYLANILAAASSSGSGSRSGSDASGSDSDSDNDDAPGDDGAPGAGRRRRRAAAARRRRAAAQFELLRRFSGVELGDAGAVEDLDLGPGFTSSSFEEDESSDEEDGGGACSSISSDGSEWCPSDGGAAAAGGAAVALEDWEALPLAARFPVTLRPPAPPAAAKPPRGGKGGKGGRGGKPAPGDKARLKRAGVEARRAARAAGRGFDLLAVDAVLAAAARAGHDTAAFPGMGKHECRQVARLAALYGMRATAQGSGKRRLVVAAATPRTALPRDGALLEVGRLLAAAAAAALGRAPAAPAVAPPPRGRWAPVRGDDAGAKAGRWGAPGSGAARRRGESAASSGARFGPSSAGGGGRRGAPFSAPVAFVASGSIDPAATPGLEVFLPGSAGGSAGAGGSAAGPAAAAHQLLQVFDGRGGGGSGGASPPTPSRRGAAAAAGITSPGRLLSLSLALGFGAEVFGAPAPEGTAPCAAAAPSPLAPRPPAAARRAAKRAKQAPRRAAAAAAPPPPAQVAPWERHTTGVGSAMLAKMGWRAGEGLGARRDGIAAPIVAARRGKGVGLGAE